MQIITLPSSTQDLTTALTYVNQQHSPVLLHQDDQTAVLLSLEEFLRYQQLANNKTIDNPWLIMQQALDEFDEGFVLKRAEQGEQFRETLL